MLRSWAAPGRTRWCRSPRSGPISKTLDRDPISLLPPDVLVFLNVDLSALYPSALGGDVAAMIQSFVPLGPESGFSAPRDTTRVMGGVYVFQGLDFCAVVQGRFDPAALRAAADGRAAQPAQQPLVKSRYGGFDFYTVSNVGFVPLTAHTLLSGTEAGMRRVLDRLRYGKLERRVPKWMVELCDTKGCGVRAWPATSTQMQRS